MPGRRARDARCLENPIELPAMTVEVSSHSSRSQAVWWREERFRSLAVQVVAVTLVVAVFAFFGYNASVNMGREGMASGFGFLWRVAGFGSIVAEECED